MIAGIAIAVLVGVVLWAMQFATKPAVDWKKYEEDLKKVDKEPSEK